MKGNALTRGGLIFLYEVVIYVFGSKVWCVPFNLCFPYTQMQNEKFAALYSDLVFPLCTGL